MRPVFCILASAALLAGPGILSADDEKADRDYTAGTVTLGVSQTDSDTLSSKFQEFREVPNGTFAPYFRFEGLKGSLKYDFAGWNIQQLDSRYRARIGNDFFRIEGDYNRIPHSFGNRGRTLLEETREGVWELSNTLQQTFQNALPPAPPARTGISFSCPPLAPLPPGVRCVSLSDLVAPSLAAGNVVDLRLTRERGNLALTLTPGGPFEVKVSYFRERRTGNRAASGTAFGFGNVVELPETLHYLSQDVGADAQVEGSWGVARGGVHYNWFNNRVETFRFDNPFRATDSTDASAYTGPGAGSVSGPSFGLMATPPDNTTFTGTAGATLKLPSRTRFSADLSFAKWEQNDTPFIPYTTNTSILGETTSGATFPATDVSRLPASKLDGKANVKSFRFAGSTHLAEDLTLTARFRRYDFSNDTPRISFPGYVRFDAVWEEIPRISVPYSFKNDRLDTTLGYDFGKVSLEGGYRRTKVGRTFRETEDTVEDGFTAAADLRPATGVLIRGTYEKATRDYERLEMERSEDASFQAPGDPANVLAIPPPEENAKFRATFNSLCPNGVVCNLRFDQAKKDSDRIGASVQLAPSSGKASFAFSYLRTKDDYKESLYGLTKADFDTYSADVNFTPTDRANLYAFYSYEKVTNAQRGRQSGATVSATRLDDWTSDVKDKVNSFGGGADFVLKPDKWALNLFGRYQKVDGNNNLFADPRGAPGLARTAVGGVQNIPLYDDTKILTLSGELKYTLSKAWTLGAGAWFEDYEVGDSNTAGLLNYVPGSFFLSAVDGDYQATVVYVRATYAW